MGENIIGEYLRVRGIKLEIVRYGDSDKDAPTLVFLHEGLGCAALWRDFPEKLAAATQCSALVYSRSGYGKSDPCPLPRPVRFMHHEALDILPDLLEIAGVRNCILIGHSDGGSIALIYAGGTPAIPLRGLITEAAHVFCEDITADSIEKIGKLYRNSDLRRKLEKYHGRNTDCAFLGWNEIWLNPEFRKWNIEEYLPGIKVPLLVIQGAEDPYGTAAQVQAIAKQAGAGAEVLMIPDCGHCPHQEQERAALEAMTRFVRAVFG